MAGCRACMSSEMFYDIRLEDEAQIETVISIRPFLQERGHMIGLAGGVLRLREAGMMDFYDFCQDHMNLDRLSFRTGDEPWRPFRSILRVMDARWVDDLISAHNVASWVQPIVDAQGNVYGHEVLARFIQQDGSMTSPADVFAAAKLRNRIYALDRMCRMAAVSSAVYLPAKVFINFIPTSIYSPQHCLQSTIALTNKLGLASERFVFEVVESEHVEDPEHLKTILRYYHQQGFQYALDDVGEGFSTIELLRQLNPHYMKLDKKYVQGVAVDPIKQDAAEQMLNTAVQLDSVPLAEGVERHEDYVWLKEKGYRLFQGYLFGRPSSGYVRNASIFDKIDLSNKRG